MSARPAASLLRARRRKYVCSIRGAHALAQARQAGRRHPPPESPPTTRLRRSSVTWSTAIARAASSTFEQRWLLRGVASARSRASHNHCVLVQPSAECRLWCLRASFGKPFTMPHGASSFVRRHRPLQPEHPHVPGLLVDRDAEIIKAHLPTRPCPREGRAARGSTLGESTSADVRHGQRFLTLQNPRSTGCRRLDPAGKCLPPR